MTRKEWEKEFWKDPQETLNQIIYETCQDRSYYSVITDVVRKSELLWPGRGLARTAVRSWIDNARGVRSGRSPSLHNGARMFRCLLDLK